jgi:hypothetical protein
VRELRSLHPTPTTSNEDFHKQVVDSNDRIVSLNTKIDCVFRSPYFQDVRLVLTEPIVWSLVALRSRSTYFE